MSAALDALLARKHQLQQELEKIEDKVYDQETAYLGSDICQCGTVTKGFEAYLSSKEALRKRQRAFKPEDRLFSLCSVTSHATTELQESLLNPVDDLLGGTFGRGKGYPSKGIAGKGKGNRR